MRFFEKIQEEKSELVKANLNLAHEKDAVKAGELTEKEAEAMMVAFRKEAGARDKTESPALLIQRPGSAGNCILCMNL